MTTIATDGKSMAGDGLTNTDGMLTSLSFRKVRALDGGRIVGCCGPTSDQEPFIEWLEIGGDKPKLEEGFAAIVIAPNEDGCRCYYSDCSFARIPAPYAIGSGSQFAIAAMDFGLSPEAAVLAAAKRDLFTGGEVTVLHLHDNIRALEAA